MNGTYIRERPEDAPVDTFTRRLETRSAGVGRATSGRPRARRPHRTADPRARQAARMVVEYCDFFSDDLHYSRDELLGKAFRIVPRTRRRR